MFRAQRRGSRRAWCDVLLATVISMLLDEVAGWIWGKERKLRGYPGHQRLHTINTSDLTASYILESVSTRCKSCTQTRIPHTCIVLGHGLDYQLYIASVHCLPRLSIIYTSSGAVSFNASTDVKQTCCTSTSQESSFLEASLRIGSCSFCELPRVSEINNTLIWWLLCSPSWRSTPAFSSSVSFAGCPLVRDDSALSCPAISLPSQFCVSRRFCALPAVVRGSGAALKNKALSQTRQS